jgi:peptidoglycan/xylan/chitin deacetylase (PgdA/CDA1 family)
MLIEQPPWIYRAIFQGAIWKLPKADPCVYLTFDDGPVPHVTPWVLDTLDAYGIKATFFCVGDNVYKYPDLYRMLIERGHRTGNHTWNHIKGTHFRSKNYVGNVEKAAALIRSDLFRPPYGHMRLPQLYRLRKKYRIVMWDVVTRDYSPHVTPDDVVRIVQRYTRNGSIIVFHDSLKALQRITTALPRAIEWLLSQGYRFETL